MKGLILLPSLNRPSLVKNFFEAYQKTEATAPGLLLVDANDACLDDYKRITIPCNWTLVLTNSVQMGDKINEVKDRWWNLDWVGILNDDHYPITKGWDQKVIGQIKGYNIVSTNDNWKAPNRLCGFICLSGKLIRELGWFFPPGVQHLYSDDAWEFLASRAGCAMCLMDVIVEHRHAFKTNAKDGTHMKVYSDESWNSDKKAFDEWLRNSSEKDALKVVAMQPKQGVMIATLSHDGNCAVDYALGLADMGICFSQMGHHFEMARVVGSSLIPHARNSLVDMFLKSKCQKLLFVDSDQGWNRNAVLALYQSNKRIIAGVTPHKRFPINLNFEPLEQDQKYFKELTNKTFEEFQVFAKEKADAKGEIEVKHAGTGFIMIDRSVFDLMSPKVGEYEAFDSDTTVKHKEFFKMGGYNGKFRGEDWLFSMYATELKIPIYINAGVVVSHQGTHTWGR